jgi:hypothetical protein
MFIGGIFVTAELTLIYGGFPGYDLTSGKAGDDLG